MQLNVVQKHLFDRICLAKFMLMFVRDDYYFSSKLFSPLHGPSSAGIGRVNERSEKNEEKKKMRSRLNVMRL